MPENFIERMTWPEVEQAIARGVDAVLIPIGTTEQHGPHMPLDTDCFIARSLCARAAEAGEAEGVEEPGYVVGPDLHVVVLHRPVGLPVAAQVVVDHPEVLGDRRGCGREVEMAEARAVDLDHGLPLARHLIPELDAVDLRPSFHRRPSIACNRRKSGPLRGPTTFDG